jgi:hypothetical protein
MKNIPAHCSVCLRETKHEVLHETSLNEEDRISFTALRLYGFTGQLYVFTSLRLRLIPLLQGHTTGSTDVRGRGTLGLFQSEDAAHESWTAAPQATA